MKKLAVIRTETGIHKCPFGLSIKLGCQNAGNSVLKMAPIGSVSEEDQAFQLQHNVAVYAMNGEGPCIYADQIIENTNAVNCDFGDSGAGQKSVSLNPIPSYPIYYGTAGFSDYKSYPIESYWEDLGNSATFSRIYGYASLDSGNDKITTKREVEKLISKIAEQENE